MNTIITARLGDGGLSGGATAVTGTQASVTKVNRSKTNRKPAATSVLPTSVTPGLTPTATTTGDKTCTSEAQTVNKLLKFFFSNTLKLLNLDAFFYFNLLT